MFDKKLQPRSEPIPFGEASAWKSVGEGWHPLFGSFRDLGFSFEWHDFQVDEELDWAKSFHPGSIELCLNLAGTALLNDGKNKLTIEMRTLAFYHAGDPPLIATRAAGGRHQFITVEYSPKFLARHLGDTVKDLHPLVRDVLKGEHSQSHCELVPHLGMELMQLVESLRRPPVFKPAQRIWFASKATELAALFFFKPANEELFCTRAKRAGHERVEKVQGILRNQLREPPTLEEIGRQVGCSHYHLSRIFSQEVGMTFQQYLRQIRLERAAELLRTGRCNVTEAALEVGYNSLSHFSTAFHDAFGCCPGLYPLRLPLYQKSKKTQLNT
jgi:AraC-like DNA-binding protein